jgi:PAS domain S-box-containing protein
VIAIPKKFEDGTIEWDSITTDVTAFKDVENESREQQLMLQNIISNIDGAVQRNKLHPNGRDELVFLSEGYEKISGIPRNEVMGNNDVVWEQILEEDREKVVRSIEVSLKELTPWHQTWRLVNRKGELKWIQGSGTPTKQEDGIIIFDTVTTEITKLKDITTELDESRQEFRLAARAAHLGLWKLDPINDILKWDEQMFKIFGIDPKEFTGKRDEWVDALHPDDREKSVNALADTINTGSDLEFQFRIIKKDTQDIRHIRASANTIVDKNGEAVFLFGINWDVTHLVQAQEKITESNKRYALASKASQDAIWDLDIKTNILKWSPSFKELFGHKIDLKKDHLEDWARLVHPDDYDRVVLGLDRFIEAGKNKWEERYRLKKGNGEYAHVNDRGFIVRDYNGVATRMVGAMRDVTANTEFLNAIKAQNEKLKKIAWKHSHELRGPLTKVMGLASLVKQDGFKDITVDDFLNYISAAAGELDQVIREIVDASEEVGIYDPEEQEVLKK